MLRKLLLMLLLLGTALAVDAYCDTNDDSPRRLFLLSSETELVALPEYFRGYNLAYSLRDASPEMLLIPPFYRDDVQPLPALPQGSITIGIDMLLNDQKAWADQGVVLATDAQLQNPILMFGSLNDKYNLKLDKTVTIKPTESSICFDVTMAGMNFAVVDCQTTGGSNNDALYLSDSKGYIEFMWPWDAQVTNGLGRRSILYRTADALYLLSATLYDHLDPTLSDKTFIMVFKVELENMMLRKQATLKADAFGLKTLSLTDITYDAVGNIYITDVKQGVIRFTYDGTKVSNLVSFAMTGSLQAYVVTAPDLSLMVYVATSTNIQEFDWTSAKPIKINVYELPEEVKSIRDLQVSSKTILLETEDNYYFYRLGVTSIRNILSIVPNQDSVALMDSSSPQAVVVGTKNSISYVATDGYVRITNITQDLTLTIDAVSTSGTSSKTCTVQTQISKVADADADKVMQIKQPPASISVQAPGVAMLPLSDYFTGSRLQYQPKALSKDVVYEVQSVSNHVVTGVDISASSFLATLSVNSASYYRISGNNAHNYTSELCSYNKATRSTSCVQKRTFTIPGDVLTYDLFYTQLNGQNVYLMAFTSSLTPNIVQFDPLNVYAKIDDIPSITMDFPVADLQCNRLYIFVTIRDDPRIVIFQADMNTYPEVVTVNSKSFTDEQLNQIVRFRPRSVTLSPLNTNILFIRNLQSVLIMRFSRNGLKLISNIPAIEVADARVQWDVVAGNKTLAVIIASDTTNSIREYSIYDVYKPFYLRELNNLADVYMTPLNLYYTPSTEFLAIETVAGDTTQQQLSVYKLGGQAIAANYYSMATTDRLVFATSRLEDDTVIEIANLKAAKRVYSQPKLLVTGQSDPQKFKSLLPYGVSVKGVSNSVEFTGNLAIFNYQTKITESKSSNAKVELPSEASNGTRVEILANDMFNGSITHYELWCPWCGVQIKLIDHVQALTSVQSKLHLNKLLFLSQVNLVAALYDNKIEFYGNSYNYQGGVDIPVPNIMCTNMIYWRDNITLLFCSTADGKQWFVPASIKAADVATIGAPLPIDDALKVDECFEMAIAGNQLLILDNNREAYGNGYIRTFTIKLDAGAITVAAGTTLDYDSFGSPTNQMIMDMAFLNTAGTDSLLLMVTLEDTGLGYISNVNGEWKAGAVINLQSNPKVQDYILDDNQFLQLAVIQSSGGLPFRNTVLITVSNGAHLLANVVFSRSADNIYAFTSFDIAANFNKYGPLRVINWLDFVIPQNSIGCFGVMYYNGERQLITLALYELPASLSSRNTINFKTSVNETSATFDDFQSIIYLPSFSQEGRLVASGLGRSGQTNTTLYNLSSRVYLELNYNKAADFSDVTLSAFNDFSIASHKVDIEFEGADSGGLGWLLYLIIGLSGLFLLGLAYGLFKFIKRKRMEKKKLSLLNEDEEV